MFLRDYKILFKRLGFALALFTLSRLGFYFFNFTYFQVGSFQETVLAFIYGLRFDLATMLIANIFFILFSIVPFRNSTYDTFLRWVFTISNTIWLVFIIADYEFFKFNGKKLTYDLFLVSNDIQEQAFQLILNYWYLSLLVIITSFSLFKYFPKRDLSGLYYFSRIKLYFALPLSLCVFVLTGIFVRGGLQMRSLSPKDAFVFESYELGNLALNSSYTLIRSFGKKGAPLVKYYSSDKAALDEILSKRSFAESGLGKENQNVVILIVESLSQEYMDGEYTPFLNSIASKGAFFSKNFANGRRSIEALPSIMTGFPSLLNTPLSQSQYQSNKFHALPSILKSNGYRSAFFHGGKRGTMDFDAYCASIGFDEYFAKEDYPDQEHFDGHWGIFDHYFLEYTAKKLESFEKPFFAGIFTLSSHQPYTIPDQFKGKFNKGTLPIHESIGYADHAIKMFFDENKDKAWFKNTLFVITGDHTQANADKRYGSVLGRFRVPLIFYHPTMNLNSQVSDKVTQHADILPSILDLLNISYTDKLYFGASVFNEGEGRMLNQDSGSHIFISGKSMVLFDGENEKRYTVDSDFLKVLPPSMPFNETTLDELKAYIQYTFNGLRNNNIYKISK
ncbi:MAG: sulfatase-like hydrolase/transferase [Bacteriovoracaceae bacterium]|nr:sulfatase-like hydrolase/transferase [Bacteriovoracaceae bacterium]